MGFRLLQRLLQSLEVPLYVGHGQDFLSKSYSMADAQSGTRNTMQTKYPMFGVTRLFVAVAIMKLLEEGELSVHDKRCSYLGDCPAKWQPVTLEEMLTDTSGFTGMEPSLKTPMMRPPIRTMMTADSST